MKNVNIKNWQIKIFFLCWGAYMFAYLGRVNLSVAIPLMEESIGINKTGLGIVGSVLFWVYAFGQLINGRLGDKFSGRIFVFMGLFVAGIINIIFGFTTRLVPMAVLWALNGYFQSMLWGPLMKIIYQWFPSDRRSKIALYMFSSVVVGFLLTWGGLGQISIYTGYKGVFLIPGVLAIMYSCCWYLFVRNSPREAGLTLANDELSSENTQLFFSGKEREVQHTSFLQLVFRSRLFLIAVSGLPLGFIREGISLWGPMMLFETFDLNLQSTMGAALFIPIFNFLGVIVARVLIKHFTNSETKLVAIFFTGGVLACALLFFLKDSSIFVYVFLLAVCSLFLYAATSILTSVIPLNFKMTSSVAGFLDFSIYLGAGLSGIVTGLLSQKVTWSIIVLFWVLAGTIGSICVYMAGNEKVKKSFEY